MPIYEFQCPYGHTYEELVKMGETRVPCPEHSAPMGDVYGEKVLSATRTDFRYADTKLK
jgi:hypothetical protein